MPTRYGPEILRVARTQLGTSEQPLGSNLGADIRKYKAETWLNPDQPWPWCQAFANWVTKQVIGTVPIKTAAVEGLWTYAGTPEGNKYFRRFRRGDGIPQPGDFAMLSRDGRDFTHITIYQESISPTHFHGLGGNQADRVRVSVYEKAAVWGYVRLHDDGVADAPKPPKPPLYEVVVGEDEARVVAVGDRFKIAKLVAGKTAYWSKRFGGFRVRRKGSA